MAVPNPRRLLVIAGLSLGFAVPAPALAAAQGSGVLRGVVFDSLIRSTPLEGAEIWIEGTNLMARSDAAGRFELNALAPGRYVLTVYHPMLDSAGLSVPPVAVDVVAGDGNTVALATPSPVQAHHLLCPQDPLRQAGSVVGVVHNAADGKPMPAATISASERATWRTTRLLRNRLRDPGALVNKFVSRGRVERSHGPTRGALAYRKIARDRNTGH